MIYKLKLFIYRLSSYYNKIILKAVCKKFCLYSLERRFINLSKLSDLIKNRKDGILKNLQDAETKFREAEENLTFAKKNFEIAKSKAEQIRNQGSTLSNQTAKVVLESIEEDIKRLKASNLSTIRLEEEKSINEICQQLGQFALEKAIEKLNKKLNPAFQKKLIAQNIEKLSSKTLVRK